MTASRILMLALPLLLGACGVQRTAASADRDTLQDATIVGSAETPDPVLAAVKTLEQRGVVEGVVVQESFPVQIRLRAPKRVIDELNAMPRTGGVR